MLKQSVFTAVAATLVVMSVGGTPTSKGTNPTTRPAAVVSAQSVLDAWVGEFRGKTEKQVVEQLGDEGERKTWQSGDEQGLKLRYPFGPRSRLDLLFKDDRVVYVDFSVASD